MGCAGWCGVARHSGQRVDSVCQLGRIGGSASAAWKSGREDFDGASGVGEPALEASIGADGASEELGGLVWLHGGGDASDGVGLLEWPDAQLAGEGAGVGALGDRGAGVVDLHGQVEQRVHERDGVVSRDVDEFAEVLECPRAVAGEERVLEGEELVLARDAGHGLDGACGDGAVDGGEGELCEFGIDATEVRAGEADEHGCGFAVELDVVALGRAGLGPAGCLFWVGRGAADDASDGFDGLVELAGAPGARTEDEGCAVAGVLGVALHQFACALDAAGGFGVGREELVGFVDDDELVGGHEAEGVEFVEDLGGSGAGAVESDDVERVPVGALEGVPELLGALASEELVGAVEDGDAAGVVEGAGALRSSVGAPSSSAAAGGLLGHWGQDTPRRADNRVGGFHVLSGVLILTVIQGPEKGRVWELPANEPQLLGRSSEALPVTDTTVSRRHAELTPDEGRWWIRDLGSQNGTYVNGIRIQGRVRLRVGDQIRVGSTLLVYGQSSRVEHEDLVSVVRPDQMSAAVERTLSSNEDSVILAEPEPRSAAVHHLRVIYRLTALTSRFLERDELLAAVMELVFNEFKPERGVIMLSRERQGSEPTYKPAVVKYAQGRRRPDPPDRIHVSRTILSHAIKRGEGVLSSNAMNDPRFASGDSVQQLNIRSAICSPIAFQERTFGAIYIDTSIANYTFTEEQLALMNAIGRHTGLALANAEAYAEKLHTERLAAIGQTVASLSHSIKNILQGLRGGADVVEMGLKKDDITIARGGWGILKRNLDRIMNLTLNMLTYSRQRTLEIELVKVAPLLDDCASLLQDKCEQREVALIIDADPDLPPIPMDPNLMHQALMNLMTNAVEAVAPKTGAVTVRASYHSGRNSMGPCVRFAVIDNGPGVAEDKREKIFEPFHSTKGARGTGLGLAVTKRIVEEHHGTIEVAADTGDGAEFVLLLPADPKAIGDPSATAQTIKEPHGPLAGPRL